MVTILLCWYSLGWASVGLHTYVFQRLTLVGRFAHLVGGFIAFGGILGVVLENGTVNPVIWRKP